MRNWKERTLFGKILLVTGMITSISVIILAFLQLIGIWEDSIKVYGPLMAVTMIIQTVENWKSNRNVAYLSIIAAIVILTATVVIMLV